MLVLLAILLVIGVFLCSEAGIRFLGILLLFMLWAGAMALLFAGAVLGVIAMLFTLNWLVDYLQATL